MSKKKSRGKSGKHVPERALPKAPGKRPPLSAGEFTISLKYFENKGPVQDWSMLDADVLVQVLNCLKDKQLKMLARNESHADHSKAFDDIISDAQSWLNHRPALKRNQDDPGPSEYLWTWRMTGPFRIWGLYFRDDKVFYLLWADPEHKIYKSKKKK